MNEKIKQIDLSDSSIKQISDFLTSVYDDKKKFNYDYLSWLYRDNPDGEIIGFNAFDKDNNLIIACNKTYYRPLEVNNLLGDAKKARKK